jgi:ABC-type antimicrobial peptide transport system permease subunit
MGAVVVLLPRSWKVNTKMALRNIARHRARTITTMLALFVGVFAIGLILVVGQNLRKHVDDLLMNNLTYNVIAVTRGADARTLQSRLSTIPGVVASRVQQRTLISILPISIDKKPLQALLPHGNATPSLGSLGRSVSIIYLSSLEGYDVAHHQLPDSKTVQITEGRNLNASDIGKHHVLISWNLVHLAPFKGHIKMGSKLLVAGQDGRRMVTVTVVGVYATTAPGTFGTVLTTSDTVKGLAAGHASTVFYMKVDPNKTGRVLDAIGRITPNAVAINLANLGNFVDHMLSDMLVMMTAIATLSLLAGVIIIANAVALAMMERKRELGILKAVGYTSRTLLSEVLIENSIIGGTGALLAMLLVTLAVSVLSRLVFKPAFSVDGYVTYGLIIGIALVAMTTALLVSWRSVRIRPLEVLRYE